MLARGSETKPVLTKKERPECVLPENIHSPPPPPKGIRNSEGGGGDEGLQRPKKLKGNMKLNWNFQRGRGVLEKISSMVDVWMFSGTTM